MCRRENRRSCTSTSGRDVEDSGFILAVLCCKVMYLIHFYQCLTEITCTEFLQECTYRFQSVNRCVSVGPAGRNGDGQVSGSASARCLFLINATSTPITVGAVTSRKLATARRPPSNELVTSMTAATLDDRTPPERTWDLCQ